MILGTGVLLACRELHGPRDARSGFDSGPSGADPLAQEESFSARGGRGGAGGGLGNDEGAVILLRMPAGKDRRTLRAGIPDPTTAAKLRTR